MRIYTNTAGRLSYFSNGSNNIYVSFFGTSENAVKTQIAVSVYVLVAIIKKRLNIRADLYTIFQALSLTLFEKIPLIQLLPEVESNDETNEQDNQLILL